jgi:diaminopropionate ammonia-lyase
MGNIQWVENQFKKSRSDIKELHTFSEKEMKKAMNFHSSVPHYKDTPLYSLTGLSEFLGVKEIYVKDESQRFGLNAFKGLGVSYAMASYFASVLSIDLSSTNFDMLTKQVKSLSTSTFATATDGNHGKGVAWAAGLFGQNANVYMPKDSSEARLEAIQNLGANACITNLNYDDTVQMVDSLAQDNNWVLIQDTAWEGYVTIPMFIMQGYLTIIGEILEQFKDESFKEITHVILQAGVGSFAGAMAAFIHNITSHSTPKIIIVEPSNAACLYQSAVHPTGAPQRVHGDLATIMAGLACGEPNPVGWEILKSVSDYFFYCDDSISAKGMRVLGNPIAQDPKIISGESGAVPLGLLYELMSDSESSELKTKLELDKSSKILVINTEGDTDPINYRKVVWDMQ